jgi:hypothetical protein
MHYYCVVSVVHSAWYCTSTCMMLSSSCYSSNDAYLFQAGGVVSGDIRRRAQRMPTALVVANIKIVLIARMCTSP